jgi:hypothetical protein
MGWPQYILLVLFAVNLLAAANIHGDDRDGTYSFWSTIIGNGIIMGLLIWGGFFNGS